MKTLVLLFILFAGAAHAQNPDAKLHLNITFNGVLVRLDSQSVKKTFRPFDVPHTTDTLYTTDKSYTIIFKPIKSTDSWRLSADYCWDRNFTYILPAYDLANTYSSLIQDFGWRGNTQITIISQSTREIMQLFFYGVDHEVYRTVNFKKGTYVFYVPSWKQKDTINTTQKHIWAYEHTFDRINGWREILLNTIRDERIETKKNYTFTNPADNDAVKIDSTGDMGKISTYYIFNRNIPDGKYRLYVDSVLTREAIYKNQKLRGTSVIYFPEDGFEETTIINDTLQKIRRYDRFHNLVKLRTHDGKLTITSEYNTNRQLLMNRVNYGDDFYLVQRFNQAGSLIDQTVYQDHKRTIKQGTKDEIIDWHQRYEFGGDTLFITFSKNYIIDYKWIRKQTN